MKRRLLIKVARWGVVMSLLGGIFSGVGGCKASTIEAVPLVDMRLEIEQDELIVNWSIRNPGGRPVWIPVAMGFPPLDEKAGAVDGPLSERMPVAYFVPPGDVALIFGAFTSLPAETLPAPPHRRIAVVQSRQLNRGETIKGVQRLKVPFDPDRPGDPDMHKPLANAFLHDSWLFGVEIWKEVRTVRHIYAVVEYWRTDPARHRSNPADTRDWDACRASIGLALIEGRKKFGYRVNRDAMRGVAVSRRAAVDLPLAKPIEMLTYHPFTRSEFYRKLHAGGRFTR